MLRNRRLSLLLRKARRPDLDFASAARFQLTFELNAIRACFASRDGLFVFGRPLEPCSIRSGRATQLRVFHIDPASGPA
jgi:hypothetical protein